MNKHGLFRSLKHWAPRLFSLKVSLTSPLRLLSPPQFLTICDIIAACATASTNDDAGSAGSRGGAFAAIWSMFTVVAYVIGGTYILRHHKTSSAIGVLLGASFMISQLFFVLFVIFASYASKASELDATTTENTSAAGADR